MHLVVVDEQHGHQPPLFQHGHVDERPGLPGLERRGGRCGTRIETHVADRDELASPKAVDERPVVQKRRHPRERRHARPGPVPIDEEVAAVVVDRPVADTTHLQGRAEDDGAFVACLAGIGRTAQPPRQVGQGLALRFARLAFRHVAKVHRDAFRCREDGRFVPPILGRVIGRERCLDALVHRLVVAVPEWRAFQARVDLPDHASRERADFHAEDAVRLCIHVPEAPLAIEREEAFRDAFEDLHRAAVGLDGRFLDPMHDVFDAAVVGEHRHVQRRPVALLEAGALGRGPADVVAHHGHPVRLARCEYLRQRRAQGAAADSVDIGIVRKDLQQRATHDGLVRVRGLEVRLARPEDRVAGIRAQEHEHPGGHTKQSLQVGTVEHGARRWSCPRNAGWQPTLVHAPRAVSIARHDGLGHARRSDRPGYRRSDISRTISRVSVNGCRGLAQCASKPASAACSRSSSRENDDSAITGIVAAPGIPSAPVAAVARRRRTSS